MEYTKPEVVAQNSEAGSFAAGCPEKEMGVSTGPWSCKSCERTE